MLSSNSVIYTMRLLLLVLLLVLRGADAFTSTNIYERDVLYGPSQLPTTEVSISFIATQLDSTGTFLLDSGCTGSITVSPPVLNYVVQQIGNVPRDVYSFEEVSCSVTSIDAYRTALEASGETLDLVLTYDADNETIVNGNDTSAFRRRLLQSSSPQSDARITSFAATSKIRSNEARISLNVMDSNLYGLLTSYSPVSFSATETGFLSSLNTNTNPTQNALQRLADVEAKLVQRGKNTDLSIEYLTNFTIEAYLLQRTDYAEQQTQLNQLLMSSNATQLAVNTLFNATIANLLNLMNLTYYTSRGFSGILDYRIADRSISQAWIDNNELKDLATALYFYDVTQLPENYTPFVRNPGIAPNESFVDGLQTRVLIDTLTQDSVATEDFLYSGYFGNTPSDRVNGIFQATYSTYISAETLLLFSADDTNSRNFFSLLGPQNCIPPYIDSNVTYTDITQWGDALSNRAPVVPQFFNSSAPTCDVWVEVQFCACVWFAYRATPQFSYPTFRWENDPSFASGDNPSLSDICSNTNYVDSAPTVYKCYNMVISTAVQLNQVLNVVFCGQHISPVSPPFAPSPDQTDLMFFLSDTLQLRGNTTTRDCPLSYTPAGNSVPFSWTQLYGGQGGVVDNYMATVVASFIDVDLDVAQLRLARYGRIAGLETTTVSNNLYSSPQYDANGNLIYDGPATPLRCEKSTWNAYTSDLIPIYNMQVNSANLVTNNINVTISCPICNNTDSCYNMTSSVVQHVQSFDTGSFLLDSNFNVMGNISTLGIGGYIYDVPADKLSVSPVIESRSFSPSYIYLPTTVTTMPNWTKFLELNPRNVRYSAQFGGVSPQAYKQATALAPGGQQVVCATNETAAIPGSHMCTILNNYVLGYNPTTSLATLSPVRWAISFEITALSGQYFDTVDVSSRCPLVSLQPTSSGSLTLALQNSENIPINTQILYTSTAVSCPSACCLSQPVVMLIQPRFTTYYEIPQCGWINLTLSVSSVQPDASTIMCFNATGQNLFTTLQNAASALDVNFFNPVNFTELQANVIADFYNQRAYETILAFMTFVDDSSEASQSAIAALTSARDQYRQQIFDAQQQAPVAATYPINETLLRERVTELLANNSAIDNQILNEDLPYINQQAALITTTGGKCSINIVDWVNCVEDTLGIIGKGILGLGEDGLQKFNDFINSFSSDDSCPSGFLENLSHPINALSCIFDGIIDNLITIGVVVLVVIVGGCLLAQCGPSLIKVFSLYLHRQALAYEQEQKHKLKDVQSRKDTHNNLYTSIPQLQPPAPIFTPHTSHPITKPSTHHRHIHDTH
jgi:hypothetical protein